MARAPLRKDYPLSMRLPDADIAIIDRAARLRGRSRTDFMREAAVRTAEAVIMENMIIPMCASGFSAFMAELDKPNEVVPALVEIFQRQAPWEGNSAR